MSRSTARLKLIYPSGERHQEQCKQVPDIPETKSFVSGVIVVMSKAAQNLLLLVLLIVIALSTYSAFVVSRIASEKATIERLAHSANLINRKLHVLQTGCDQKSVYTALGASDYKVPNAELPEFLKIEPSVVSSKEAVEVYRKADSYTAVFYNKRKTVVGFREADISEAFGRPTIDEKYRLSKMSSK